MEDIAPDQELNVLQRRERDARRLWRYELKAAGFEVQCQCVGCKNTVPVEHAADIYRQIGVIACGECQRHLTKPNL